jgi:hypothetical protein
MCVCWRAYVLRTLWTVRRHCALDATSARAPSFPASRQDREHEERHSPHCHEQEHHEEGL